MSSSFGQKNKIVHWHFAMSKVHCAIHSFCVCLYNVILILDPFYCCKIVHFFSGFVRFYFRCLSQFHSVTAHKCFKKVCIKRLLVRSEQCYQPIRYLRFNWHRSKIRQTFPMVEYIVRINIRIFFWIIFLK